MDLDHKLYGAERAADSEARKPEASTAPSIALGILRILFEVITMISLLLSNNKGLLEERSALLLTC